MNVLVIDIGGTYVKILATGQKERRRFESGPNMTPQLMVAGVKKLAADWKYDVEKRGCWVFKLLWTDRNGSNE